MRQPAWSSAAAAAIFALATTMPSPAQDKSVEIGELLTSYHEQGAGVRQASSRKRCFDDSTFTSLFDGKSLKGWVTKGGRYDGNARWSVEGGMITGREGPRRAGGLIYTERRYTNFILTLDVRIDEPFDSGIFLRMAPKPKGKGAQVTLDYRPNGEVGAIYADGFLHHNKTAKAKFRGDDWNHFEVRCTGKDMHIEVWMNGELITDYAIPKNSPGYVPTGLIGLQVHGAQRGGPEKKVQFKNIKIRELPVFDTEVFTVDDEGFLSLMPEAKTKDWSKLFNGKDLSGWEPVGSSQGYVVRDGMLVFPTVVPTGIPTVVPKKGSGGYLRTKEDFRDFVLRLDFRVAKMANSGIFLRGNRQKGNPGYSGCEIQILDDFNWEKVTGTKLRKWQFTGSLYGSVAPKVKDALNPIGMWNSYRITYKASRMRVELNGFVLYDVDTHEVGGKPPFADRAREGFIGLQRHAPRQVEDENYAWFRNIFIRKLSSRQKL